MIFVGVMYFMPNTIINPTVTLLPINRREGRDPHTCGISRVMRAKTVFKRRNLKVHNGTLFYYNYLQLLLTTVLRKQKFQQLKFKVKL